MVNSVTQRDAGADHSSLWASKSPISCVGMSIRVLVRNAGGSTRPFHQDVHDAEN